MIVTLLILAISAALLVYWFRFCCLGLLRNAAGEPILPPDNRFSFPAVRERLRTESDLDPLHQLLDRDYRIVSYLLRHAAGLGGQSVEHRLLLLDYKLMQVWYWLTRNMAPGQARNALTERAAILGCLAQKMGEQAGLRAQA
jgi:hypothetical protein